MQEKVRNTIAKFHMFPRNARIIVGLSGGADSVALLHVLCTLRQAFDWDITAVHIHHGLRGAEADADEAFAKDFCTSLGVPCIVKRYDVKAEAKKRRLGEEETGRLLRYAAFREVAGTDGCIAVAHHQKDQAETMLMRLCRGTGLTGLTSMTPVRGNICRPLLCCSREEIEAYCIKNHLDWREDATNQEEKYTRNKLRLRVLPILAEINPKAVAHMAETAELLSAEEDFLEQQAAACYSAVRFPSSKGEVHLDRTALRELHPAMRRRVLRKAMGAFLQTDVTQVQIEALEELLTKETGKSRDFAEGIHGENRYDRLVLSQKKEEARSYSCELPLGEEVFIPEAGIVVKAWVGGKEAAEGQCFDFAKLKGELSCRTRQTGDFICLKNGRKKIKDLFIDEKIPRGERDSYPLITVGEEVLWVPGIRVSAAYPPTAETTEYLYIHLQKA